MSTNFEYREREKVGNRSAKLNQKKSDRQLERKEKTKETFFVGKKTWKKQQWEIRNASSHQDENKQQWTTKAWKVNKSTYDISSIERVTRSRAKQRQRNVQEKCAAPAKLLFC